MEGGTEGGHTCDCALLHVARPEHVQGVEPHPESTTGLLSLELCG